MVVSIRPRTLSEIRAKLREAETCLEEARRMMVYGVEQKGDNAEVSADDVHALALAQVAVGRARERLAPEARATEARAGRKR